MCVRVHRCRCKEGGDSVRSEHQRCDHLVPLDLLLQVPVGAVLITMHSSEELLSAAYYVG